MFLEYFITFILLKAKRPFRKRKMNIFPKELENIIIDYKNQLEITDKMGVVLEDLKDMYNINTVICNNCMEYKHSLNWASWKDINFCGKCLEEMNMEIDDFPDEEDEEHQYYQWTM